MTTKPEIRRKYDEFADKVTMSRKFYLSCIRMIGGRGGRLLDAGCGQGHLLVRMPRTKGVRLHGFDFSFELSMRSARNNPDARIVQADLERLPYKSGSFDSVLVTEVLPYLPDQEAALREVARVVRPGGRVLVAGINREWLRYDWYQRTRREYQPVEERFLRYGEVEALLRGAGFRVVRVRGAENLYAGGGLPRLLERLAMLLFPALHKRMKRILILAERNAS